MENAQNAQRAGWNRSLQKYAMFHHVRKAKHMWQLLHQPTCESPSKARMCVATLSKNQRSWETTRVEPAKLETASSRHLPGH